MTFSKGRGTGRVWLVTESRAYEGIQLGIGNKIRERAI